jgi:hypothetical protein
MSLTGSGLSLLLASPPLIFSEGVGELFCGMSLKSQSTSLVVIALLAIALCDPAAARIQCQGNFQITKYGPIASSYCEEEQIALVAQSSGWNVSASEVHNNLEEDRSLHKPWR